MQRRIPAARNAEAIGLDALARAASRADGEGGEAPAPMRRLHHRAGKEAEITAFPPPGHGAVAVEIATQRPGLHDAGAIIAGEGNGALDGAGGEHRALRDDPPAAFERGGTIGQVMRHLLDRAPGALIIGAGDGGAGHHPHILHPAKLTGRRPSPAARRIIGSQTLSHAPRGHLKLL